MIITAVSTQSPPENKWAACHPWEWCLQGYNSVGDALVKVHCEYSIFSSTLVIQRTEN